MNDSIVPVKRAPRLVSLQSKAPTGISEGPMGFLCFTLDKEEYGVDLQLVSQVVKSPPVTWVPRVPSRFLGVVSIRGEVVTLLDLRDLMGLKSTAWPRSSRVLIVDSQGEEIGLLVDSVTQVRRFKLEALENRPYLKSSVNAEHILCIARSETNQPILIVDLNAVLQETLK